MDTKQWLEYYTTHPQDFDNMIKLAEGTILQQASQINELTESNARLTAAHAIQDESLVVLPRHMVNSIEEKMKEQAAEIERLTEKVRYAYVQIEALERVK